MNKALLLVTSLLLIPAAANAASPAERERLSQEASGEIRESVKELKGDALERRQMIQAGDREGAIAKTKEIRADRRELRGEVRNHQAARKVARVAGNGERRAARQEKHEEHFSVRQEQRQEIRSENKENRTARQENRQDRRSDRLNVTKPPSVGVARASRGEK